MNDGERVQLEVERLEAEVERLREQGGLLTEQVMHMDNEQARLRRIEEAARALAYKEWPWAEARHTLRAALEEEA